jgi:hypothetical protein
VCSLGTMMLLKASDQSSYRFPTLLDQAAAASSRSMVIGRAVEAPNL